MHISRHIGSPLSLALAALCCLLAPACSGEGGGARNLILISVDTLRADHLGCYGYPRDTTPTIDRLAERGTLFEAATSTGAWTVPSHMSMLTGTYTRTHGIDGFTKALPAEIETIASLLSEEGFATQAFVNVQLLNREKGYNRGFDDYKIFIPATSAMGSTRRIVARAIDWLRENQDRRFFLFLHFYDVHSDFNPLPEFRRDFVGPYQGPANGTTAQLRAYRKGDIPRDWTEAEGAHLKNLYDGGLRQFDNDLAALFDFVEGGELGADTLIVLTSDHGEEFLEHGGIMHGRTLYEELVHVPLILAGPGVPAGQRFEDCVSGVDIMPTVLSLLGERASEQSEGVDLSIAWRNPPAWDDERLVFAEADKWLGQEEGNFRRSVRKGKFKLYYDKLTGRTEVYDLESDPRERNDISEQQPALTKALWGEMDRFISGKREVEVSLELSEEEMREIEKLGY
jgi:arylsulfatase A-like enzyme